jgi:lipopolysaccharide transport system ATP-binding protein
MSRSAIRVDGLWKQYRIGERERNGESFREVLARPFLVPFRWIGAAQNGSSHARPFWALRDVSFTVDPGEIVGVIGRNGAGKTTLLKVISKITAPTRGRVEVLGRLGSLLEVGTGFHPELTGRENIYINGSILGMRRADIRRKFDEIVAFAEVEQFLDTPVKRYSTGMGVRLAFSIAAHLEPDILLVDEVLAVGDVRFQRKCLGKMDEVRRDGRTVLFVSHNLGAISKLCGKGLMLNDGQVACYGEVKDAVRAYARLFSSAEQMSDRDFSGPLGDKIEFKGISINGERPTDALQVSPSEPITIRILGEAKEDLPPYRTTVSISRDGQLVISRHDTIQPESLPKGRFESKVTIPAYFLSPGQYSVRFGGYTPETGAWTLSVEQAWFSVMEEWSKEFDTLSWMGLVNLPDVGSRTHVS